MTRPSQETAQPSPGDRLNSGQGTGFTSQHGERYLEAAIQTASPAKLRLMLLERACEVGGQLSRCWREDEEKAGANEYSLKLLELLNELLSGITAQESNLGDQVADLYVFLIQHLIAAENHSDSGAIDEIRTILEVEAETWRLVCAQDSAGGMPPKAVLGTRSNADLHAGSGGFDFEV